MAASAQTQAQQNQQLNLLARQAIRARGVRRIQQIFDSDVHIEFPFTDSGHPAQRGIGHGILG